MKPIKRVYSDRVEYQVNGIRHRLDGPAIIWDDESKEWWVNGCLHREDGPAVDHRNAAQQWYIVGLKHRLDGPAVIWPDGSQYWYINGKPLTEEINYWFKETNFNRNYTTWTLEDKLQFKLRWY